MKGIKKIIYLNPAGKDVVSIVARCEVDPGDNGDKSKDSRSNHQPVHQPVKLGER